MSQVSIIDIEGNNPQIPTEFIANIGSAIPIANTLEILGATVPAGVLPVYTTGSGNTITTNVQISQAIAASNALKVGVAAFDSQFFTVDANGFVSLTFPIEVENTITPDVGGAIAPIANNWNILGYDEASASIMDTHNTGAATLKIENRAWITPFVVDASTTPGERGTFSSVQAAIAMASSGQFIFIRPGTYTENLALKAGVILVGLGGATIVGKATASTAGGFVLKGLTLQTNSDFALVVSSNVATVVAMDQCNIVGTNNTLISYTSSSASSQISLLRCGLYLQTTGIAHFASSSAGTINLRECILPNDGSSTTASTISAGTLGAYFTEIYAPITSSGTSAIGLFKCHFDTHLINTTCLTHGGSGTSAVTHCTFESGSASALSISQTLTISECGVSSSNASAIAGAGTINFGAISFYGSSSLIAATTQVPLVLSNDAIKVKSPGAYPYTTIPQDQLILVDTSSARTITPLASPTTGQRHIIKDNVGTAATNNITVTPSGKNIDGAASFIISTNWGSITIVYNGSEWSVI